MSRKAVVLSVVRVAAGGSGEELILRVPVGFWETEWHRVVARDDTTSLTRLEIWARVHAMEYCLVADVPGAAARTVSVNTRFTAPDDVSFVAKFYDAVAGDVLGLWAFGEEREKPVGA